MKIIKLEGNLQNQTSINLGDDKLSSRVTELVRESSQGTDCFLVEWDGSKIPRGAIIKGQAVTWTQNGSVYAASEDGFGKAIGSYQRIVNDLSQQPQVMLIFA